MRLKDYVNEILIAFEKRYEKKLRKLNDKILQEASVLYSKPLYFLAVLSYVLSKILSKPRYMDRKYFERIKEIEKRLGELYLCKEELSEQIKCFKKLEDAIKNLEVQDSRFVIDLFSKGRLKVAATLYAQGLSLGTASEITGIEKQEILSYAGHTKMFDRVEEDIKAYERLKTLKKVLEE